MNKVVRLSAENNNRESQLGHGKYRKINITLWWYGHNGYTIYHDM